MAPGPVISDMPNCPFLILFANSIPLNINSGCVAKKSRDTKMLNDTSAQAATLKRLDTNLTCPRMSPLPTPRSALS
jgi:hypothetical protein